MTEHFDDLPFPPEGVWDVTTENGTTTRFDFDNRKWVRLPAVHDDGQVHWLPGDLKFQRLGWGPYLTSWETGRPKLTADWGEPGVRVGFGVNYGTEMSPEYHHFSTVVVAIRRVAS